MGADGATAESTEYGSRYEMIIGLVLLFGVRSTEVVAREAIHVRNNS